jgi:DNA-binding NarL/FixJ family response regulator
MVVPVVFRRKYPVAAFAAVIADGALQVLLLRAPIGADLAVLILLYTLAACRPRRISLGGLGFLLKDVPPAELLFAIRSVHAGDSVVAPSTTRRLIDRFVPLLPADGPPPSDLAALTEREREVLIQVAAGLSNAEIATRLFVSEATVKTHVGRILAKLGLRDRVQAVVLAYESGLVKARGRPSG